MVYGLVNVLAATTENGHDWIPTIGAVIICLITGLFSWWSNRSKNKSDQFKVFMDESAEFREEIKKDRDLLESQLKEAQIELELLRKRTMEYEKLLQEYNQQLEDRKVEIEILTMKVMHLRTELMKHES